MVAGAESGAMARAPQLLSIPMRHFLEVAQTGSVNQAAARLHVAPSAVSRQIARLEDEMGTPLFERRTRGMTATAAGERLAAYLRHAVADGLQALEQASALGRVQAQRVCVACTEGFAPQFMPGAMQAFRDAHGEARLELRVGSPDEVARWLLRGEADLGLKYSVAPESELHVEYEAPAPVYAVMAPEHPLARHTAVEVAQVVAFPLYLGSRGMTTRQLFDQACSLQGLRYVAAFESNFSSVLLPLLRMPGIVLSGHLTVAHLIADGTVVARPFAEAPLQQRRLRLLSLPGRTPTEPVRAFATHLAQAIQAVGRRKLGRARRAAPARVSISPSRSG